MFVLISRFFIIQYFLCVPINGELKGKRKRENKERERKRKTEKGRERENDCVGKTNWMSSLNFLRVGPISFGEKFQIKKEQQQEMKVHNLMQAGNSRQNHTNLYFIQFMYAFDVVISSFL